MGEGGKLDSPYVSSQGWPPPCPFGASPPYTGGKAWMAFGRPHMYQAKNSPPQFLRSEGVCDPGSLPETPVTDRLGAKSLVPVLGLIRMGEGGGNWTPLPQNWVLNPNLREGERFQIRSLWAGPSPLVRHRLKIKDVNHPIVVEIERRVVTFIPGRAAPVDHRHHNI